VSLLVGLFVGLSFGTNALPQNFNVNTELIAW